MPTSLPVFERSLLLHYLHCATRRWWPGAGWLAHAGLDELIEALDDGDLEVRWVAWTLIEEIIKATPAASGDAWIEALRSRCDDDCVRIRVIGAAVMARLGEPSALGRLLELVENTRGLGRPDQAEIARRFGQFRFAPARAWLVRHARRSWFEGALWWPAIVALAGLGDESARSTILEELKAGSVRRRGRALEAVKALGLVAALDRVKELAQRSNRARSMARPRNARGARGTPGLDARMSRADMIGKSQPRGAVAHIAGDGLVARPIVV